MKPQATSSCQTCGARIPAGLEFCPVCAFRGALGDTRETSEFDVELSDSSPGLVFEHYQILTREDGTPLELGRGAMGVTYKAVDANLRCAVALKVINARFIGDETARRRFVREARAAASVRHPNVASVFHLGQTGDGYFYAMEFVEGETLENLIKRAGQLELKQALEIASQATAGLAAVHKGKLVHRDIKPSNLMVSLDEAGCVTAKIIDLGLAKSLDEQGSQAAISMPGGFAGTPTFASPEQFAGVGVDIRSDLYSLGVVLWEMLTGRPPFQGTPAELIYLHQHGVLPLERLKGVPKRLTAILETLLDKDPKRRFQTPAELSKTLSVVRSKLEKAADQKRKVQKPLAQKSRVITEQPRPGPAYGEGLFKVSSDGFGFLRDPKRNYVQSPQDIFVTPEVVRKHALRDGLWIKGEIRYGSRGSQLSTLTEINGEHPDRYRNLPVFEELTSLNPKSRIRLETVPDRYTTRVMDLMTPVGKGQRGLIVAPPRTGKTTLLQHIADAVVQNHPEINLIMLLVDERREEVTEMRRTVPQADIMASSNGSGFKRHTQIAQLAIERAKRLVEAGKDVLLLMDSLTRLGRAFNNAVSNRRRTVSDGMDPRAIEILRNLFAAARNTEEAGSLTIMATALIETGSKMDELILQEFKGTGNMEMVLDRQISDQRVYPAIDIFKSGTRREELLIPANDLEKINTIRRGLARHRPVEAIESLLFFLRKFPTNAQMLRKDPRFEKLVAALSPNQRLLKPRTSAPGARTRKALVTGGPKKISIARLPVTGSDLFGREEEIAFLDRAWANQDVNIVTVVAWAGVGKSTLINHWVRKMAAEHYRSAELVFGWSFYRQGTGGETSSADEFIDAALTWFGDPDPRLGSAWQKGERLAKLVADRRTLLILDGLEPLQNPPGPNEGRLRESALQALCVRLPPSTRGFA